MAIIGITTSSTSWAKRYADAVKQAGGEAHLILPATSRSSEELLKGIDGLLLTGGADIGPSLYSEDANPDAGVEVNVARDRMELPLIKLALERDMPILGICRGMQALNVVMGGRLIQDIPGHKAGGKGAGGKSAYHRIWISPGSKLAHVLGSGGNVKVNSRHHQGIREAQKAPALVASAYSPEDFIIEALESPNHRWVIGIQCHPERGDELPRQFLRLFQSLIAEAGSAKIPSEERIYG